VSHPNVHIPPQEPKALLGGAFGFYGEGLLGERIALAKITKCFLRFPWHLNGKRVTVYLNCKESPADDTAILTGYIYYNGKHVAGTVRVCSIVDGRDVVPAVVFEPSAKHLDRFEEPKYFE